MAGTIACALNGTMEHPHDPRYCRTHAFVAELYAANATGRDTSDTWKYLATSWSDLADIRSRTAELDRQMRKLRSDVYGARRALPPLHSE